MEVCCLYGAANDPWPFMEHRNRPSAYRFFPLPSQAPSSAAGSGHSVLMRIPLHLVGGGDSPGSFPPVRLLITWRMMDAKVYDRPIRRGVNGEDQNELEIRRNTHRQAQWGVRLEQPQNAHQLAVCAVLPNLEATDD